MRSTPSGPTNTRASPNMRAASPNMRAASPNPTMRAASPNPYLPTTAAGYPGSNFSSSPALGHANPLPRSTTPFGSNVYPPGHVLEGQQMSRSRPVSPMPGGHGMPFPQGASPRMPGGIPFPHESNQLAAPEGFSRPINMTGPFTPFPDTFIQGMNRFFDSLPRMAPILQAHDVLEVDWSRLMKVCYAGFSFLVMRPKSHLGHCTRVGRKTSSSRSPSRCTAQKRESRRGARRSLEHFFLFRSWCRACSLPWEGETHWSTCRCH
jgi:hypothetical protein